MLLLITYLCFFVAESGVRKVCVCVGRGGVNKGGYWCISSLKLIPSQNTGNSNQLCCWETEIVHLCKKNDLCQKSCTTPCYSVQNACLFPGLQAFHSSPQVTCCRYETKKTSGWTGFPALSGCTQPERWAEQIRLQRAEELLLLSTEKNQLKCLKTHSQHVLTPPLGMAACPVWRTPPGRSGWSWRSCRRKQRTVWSSLWKCCPHDPDQISRNITKSEKRCWCSGLWHVPAGTRVTAGSLWDWPSPPYFQFLAVQRFQKQKTYKDLRRIVSANSKHLKVL